MSKPNTIYEVYDDEHTFYRLIPNPDAPYGEGFKWGAVLQHRDDNQTEWRDSFFIGPESMEGLSQALALAAKDVQK